MMNTTQAAAYVGMPRDMFANRVASGAPGMPTPAARGGPGRNGGFLFHEADIHAMPPYTPQPVTQQTPEARVVAYLSQAPRTSRDIMRFVLRRWTRHEVDSLLDRMVADGTISRVGTTGRQRQPVYAHP